MTIRKLVSVASAAPMMLILGIRMKLSNILITQAIIVAFMMGKSFFLSYNM